jgi:hypothetical protein
MNQNGAVRSDQAKRQTFAFSLEETEARDRRRRRRVSVNILFRLPSTQAISQEEKRIFEARTNAHGVKLSERVR